VSPLETRFDAVICDIDGCLAPESVAPLDPRALGLIAHHNRLAIAQRDRPVLTLCSGRPQPFVECLCRLLSNTAVPCIAEMGVWVFDPRDQGFHLDPAITPDHLAAVRDATRWIELELLPRGVVIQPGKTASISLWHPHTPTLFALKPLLARTFADRAWPLRVSSTVAWINCDLEHVNKDTGIARVLAMTGLSPARLAGIGDTLGDLAIRRSVAWFACPSNAVPELKAQADFVSHLPEVEGVLDILERLHP
jgi:hydroxymethylpyrimidine pyrophosphatase-like HAD family hydrolase